MCGIVGYIGKRNALKVIIKGLKALEYRGYDSSGVAACSKKGEVLLLKKKGRVRKLERLIKAKDFPAQIGIGHTRWSTHGVPSERNAHPHFDCQKRIFVVHNGIIENYKELQDYLLSRGHKFLSETDTEVVPHLIEEFLKTSSSFKEALFDALKMIEGSYALVIFDKENPTSLFAARLSSPLVIGVGEKEKFLASDASALVGLTRKVVYLKDGEVAQLSSDKVKITDLSKNHVPLEIEHLKWDLEKVRKGNFPHFMLKEIFEGPEVVRSALTGRLKTKEGLVKLGGLEEVEDKLKDVKRIIIIACGTSYYAGMIGEYFFEEIAKIPTEVQIASEFRYKQEPFMQGTVLLAISQSGETADTLAGVRKAKDEGLLTLGVVNVVGSTIARETDAGVYNHAGPEIGVASTKAFLSQLTVLLLMALYLSRRKRKDYQRIARELSKIPSKIELILKNAPEVEKLAKKYKKYKNFLFLGRRYSYPVALEGALKLKEISYLHAEGYGAGEMKHGPIAMIGPDFPTVAVVPKNNVSEKMYSNIEEIKSRKGRVLAIATQGDKRIKEIADDVFYIPPTLEPLEPFLAVVPLHLFAYYIGTSLGYDVDKPRNLAKSVTVE
jgi:glucosamine--fructose-6-phosphate aminotransferase (isomerizing)